MTARLEDLGIEPEEPERASHGSSRPVPTHPATFGGRWLVHCYDFGANYDSLIEWLDAHRIREPDGTAPVATLMGLARDPDETERDHIVRASLQVALRSSDNVVNGTRPASKGAGRPRMLRHTDGSANSDIIRTLPNCPLVRYRLELADLCAIPEVLVALARDPDP